MRLLRLILGDPDPRSTREVERDIADELATHVEMIEEELREAGQDADQARAEAARRFGDIEHYRRLCRRVTLKERLMLQRINLALLVVVMIALGVTAWQSWKGQARTAEAVAQLTKQLEAMNARTGAPGAAEAAPGGVVVITGVIDREGQYLIPPGGLTLRRALTAAGWSGMRPIRIKVERAGEADARAFTWEQMSGGADMPLANNDTITVYTAVIDAPAPAGLNRRASGLPGGPPQGDIVVSGTGVRTGVHSLADAGTVLRALAAAGWDGKAPVDVALRRRGVPDMIVVEWVSLQRGEDLALLAGDALGVVPSGSALVSVTGEVERPGVIPFRESLTLRSALTESGADLAVPADVRVQRTGQAPEIIASTERLQRGENWRLKPGDQVTVSKRERPKADRYGRVAELALSARVVERVAELRADCFNQYDQATRMLGLPALSAKTDTVLIVGGVDRPGVYLIDAAPLRDRSFATIGDLVRAAGAHADTNAVTLVPAKEGLALNTLPASGAFQRRAGEAAGMIIVVTADRASDASPVLFAQMGAGDARWSPVHAGFNGPFTDHLYYWARTVQAIGESEAERVDDRANVHPDLIDGAIDVFPTSGAWLEPVRFLTKQGMVPVQPSSLAEILHAVGPNRLLGAKTVTITVRGTPNPVRTELPIADALASDLMIQPGSVIWVRAETPR